MILISLAFINFPLAPTFVQNYYREAKPDYIHRKLSPSTYPSSIENQTNFFRSNSERDETPTTASVIGSDDRIRVSPTTSFPWISICKIYAQFSSSNIYTGSGAMIDEQHVLTAAHVIYSEKDGGWATGVLVIPGMDNGAETSIGSAGASDLYTCLGWALYETPENDFAVIKLDKQLGKETGYMDLYSTEEDDPAYTGTINTAGYPGELDQGLNMYRTAGTGYETDDYFHYYFLDVTGGQSGSPVWVYDGQDRYIISVISYGSTNLNLGPRLNKKNSELITEWLQGPENTDNEEEQPTSIPFSTGLWICITISTLSVISIKTFYKLRKK